jgi:hypothetical protein
MTHDELQRARNGNTQELIAALRKVRNVRTRTTPIKPFNPDDMEPDLIPLGEYLREQGKVVGK